MEPTDAANVTPDSTPGLDEAQAAAAEAAAEAEAAQAAGAGAAATAEPSAPAAAAAVDAAAADAGAGGEAAAAGTAVAVAAGADGIAVVASDEEEEKKRRRRLALLMFLLLVFASLLTLLSLWYLVYRRPIDTLLPPTSLNEPPHYLFSMYDATKPVAVAVSGAGDRVYVVQSAGDRQVAIFDGSGKEIGDLQPPSDNLPHTPAYVAVDPRDGDVYVTDRATGAIYVYSSNGSYLREFKPKVDIPGWQPLGVALSPNGSWWITDLSAPYHRIEIFSQDGTLTSTIGAPGQFDFPNNVAFDTNGNAYVTDSNNGRLVVLDPSGTQLATIGRGSAPGNLGLPRGVALDDQGRLYVVDATGQFVHMYRIGSSSDWRPTFLNELGGQGIGDGQFNFPNGITIDSRYRLYITDRENDRVQVWGF